MVDLIKRLFPLSNGTNNGWRETRIGGNSGKAKVNQQWPGVIIIGYVFTNKNKTFICIVCVHNNQVYIDKDNVISIKVVLIIESIICLFIESAIKEEWFPKMQSGNSRKYINSQARCVLCIRPSVWIYIFQTLFMYLFCFLY